MRIRECLMSATLIKLFDDPDQTDTGRNYNMSFTYVAWDMMRINVSNCY